MERLSARLRFIGTPQGTLSELVHGWVYFVVAAAEQTQPRMRKPVTNAYPSWDAFWQDWQWAPSIGEVHLKLHWAEEAIRHLEHAIADYAHARTHTPRIVSVPGPLRTDEGETSSRYDVIATDVVPIPDSVLLLAGDVVHSLQASLDYLAWRLVELSGFSPNKSTKFPVKWDSAHDLRVHPRIRDDILELIDDAQPYRTDNPAAHPLKVIHDLDVIDKHRHLSLLVATIGEVEVTIRTPDGASLVHRHMGGYRNDEGVWRHQVLQEGSVLSTFAPANFGRASLAALRAESAVRLRIVLGEEGPPQEEVQSPLAVYLRDLLAYVRNDLLPPFDRLFLRHPKIDLG